MSGILALFDRRGDPPRRSAVGAMMGRLAHRGPDGGDVLHRGPVALGHQHLWTVPEEVGERQPLSSADGTLHLAFDGRLDNREELLAGLGLDHDLGRRRSDARLVLDAYRHRGEECLRRLLGPFALALYDEPERRLLLARDALGARPLCYHLNGWLLVAASEEAAVLAHPAVPADLDEESHLRYLALEAPRRGATFFRGVQELPPGSALVVEEGRERSLAHWSFEPRRLTYRRDSEYAEHFREVLTASIRCRMRSPSPPAILMSGGLDSTTVAGFAATENAAGSGAGAPRVISWIFDELAGCDEREYITSVVAHHDLPAIQIRGDDAWPLAGGTDSWPWSPNSPFANPYRLLLDRAYGAAAGAGGRTLLTGWFGDQLYLGEERWLVDLLRDGRWWAAGGELLRHLVPGSRRRGLQALWALTGRRRTPRWEERWLRPGALAQLHSSGEGEVPARESRPRRVLNPLDVWHAREERRFACRAAVDPRHPYRDRRLVELALALPAHQLYRCRREKHVLRGAAEGILPPEVLERQGHSLLTPLLLRGLAEREVSSVTDALDRLDDSSRRFLRGDWLERVRRGGKLSGIDAVAIWQIVAWVHGMRESSAPSIRSYRRWA